MGFARFALDVGGLATVGLVVPGLARSRSLADADSQRDAPGQACLWDPLAGRLCLLGGGDPLASLAASRHQPGLARALFLSGVLSARVRRSLSRRRASPATAAG